MQRHTRSDVVDLKLSTVAERSVQQDLQSFFVQREREGVDIISLFLLSMTSHQAEGSDETAKIQEQVYKIHWQPLLFRFAQTFY